MEHPRKLPIVVNKFQLQCLKKFAAFTIDTYFERMKFAIGLVWKWKVA